MRQRPSRLVGPCCSSCTTPRSRTSATRKSVTSLALIALRACAIDRRWHTWKPLYWRSYVKATLFPCRLHIVCPETSHFMVTASLKTPWSYLICPQSYRIPRYGATLRTSGRRDLSALMENWHVRRSSFPLAQVERNRWGEGVSWQNCVREFHAIQAWQRDSGTGDLSSGSMNVEPVCLFLCFFVCLFVCLRYDCCRWVFWLAWLLRPLKKMSR